MNRKKLLIGIGILTLVVVIVGLNIYRNQQSTAIAALYFPVRQENIKENVLASGKVEVVQKEEITAQTNAIVQDVLISEGEQVKAGQVLIKLATDELIRDLRREEANLAIQQANLAKAKASARPQEVAQDKASITRAQVNYNNAKTKYGRFDKLFQEGAVSKEAREVAYLELITAETDYRSAQQRLSLRLAGDTYENKKALEAQVKQAELSVNLAKDQLAKAEVKSSIDGVILSLGAEEGKYITTGTTLVVIGNIDRLRVKADVSESDSGLLAAGQPVKIITPALPDEEFIGKVFSVGAAAVTRNKSGNDQTDVRVIVDIIKFNNKLKPGYSVDLTITTASKDNALIIPYEAVIEKDKKKEVYIIKDKKAVKKQIVTGVGNELYLTVEKGLTKGDKVIVNPNDKLKEGSVVKETLYDISQTAADKKGD